MKTDGKRRVLVVDDDEMTANTLTTILARQGYEAQALYSGEDAIKWSEKFQPDIVLTDVRMRKVSGVDTAVRVRELHPACRVILFTASQLSPAERKTVQKLDFEFIERPLHPTDLLARLKA